VKLLARWNARPPIGLAVVGGGAALVGEGEAVVGDVGAVVGVDALWELPPQAPSDEPAETAATIDSIRTHNEFRLTSSPFGPVRLPMRTCLHPNHGPGRLADHVEL